LEGSEESNGIGFPDFVAQNLQVRVHTSPIIIKVAVPLLQHSHWLGHLPLLQMVCNWFSEITLFTKAKFPELLILIFNQSGLRVLFIKKICAKIKLFYIKIFGIE
jgi:hypothetical protein